MAGTRFSRNQRVKVDLSGLVVQGVTFGQNVREAPATIVDEKPCQPPAYVVGLLFSFKGINRVEVPGDRIKAA